MNKKHTHIKDMEDILTFSIKYEPVVLSFPPLGLRWRPHVDISANLLLCPPPICRPHQTPASDWSRLRGSPRRGFSLAETRR